MGKIAFRTSHKTFKRMKISIKIADRKNLLSDIEHTQRANRNMSYNV